MDYFSKKLKNTRKSQKLTQSELSEISGVSAALISIYETGKSSPTINMLEWLCKALKVSSTDLLGF